jgi:hypothetical protein
VIRCGEIDFFFDIREIAKFGPLNKNDLVVLNKKIRN